MSNESAIVAITAGVNPVSGVDSYVIEYSDGETQSHEGPWSEARELADRVGLDHREDGTHWTRWARRGLHPPRRGRRSALVGLLCASQHS